MFFIKKFYFMSSRKYDICKPFYDRAELSENKFIDKDIEIIEEIMYEYNSLDELYMKYQEKSFYYDYDDYDLEPEYNDKDVYEWDKDKHELYLSEINDDLLPLDDEPYTKKVFLSEIRSFKNCWKNYNKRESKNCLSIYAAPFTYFGILMPEILKNLTLYEEFNLKVVLFNKEEQDIFPANLKNIPNEFLYYKYLIFHKNPKVLDLLHTEINSIFEKLIENFYGLSKSSINDIEANKFLYSNIDHVYLFNCTSQKLRLENLYKNMNHEDKIIYHKKKI